MNHTSFVLLLITACLAGCGPPPPRPGEKPVPQEDVKIPAEKPVSGKTPQAAAGDWPWWRGPALDGSAAGSAPLKWSRDEQVLWKSEVPGKGFASPIVCGDKIFIATADDREQKQMLLCYDRATGSQEWSQLVSEGGFNKINPANSQASATPAWDGEHVYVAFVNHDALWVTAYDLAGKQLWQKQAGPFGSEHGYGPSPVFYKSAVIVAGDNLASSYLTALDRKTGEILWRTPRERLDRHGSYATPIIGHVAGKDQLVLAGYSKVTSYDPATGKLLWWCQGPSQVAACTVAFGEGRVFASGGYPEKQLLAIEADGSGDVTDTHVAWQTAKGATYVPSPLYHEGNLFVVTDNGIMFCYDAQTGKQRWQHRLPGKYSASPVLADGKLYVTSEVGVITVLRASSEYEQLAENDMQSDGHATPAIAAGQIYLRMGDGLYCIGSEAREARRNIE